MFATRDGKSLVVQAKRYAGTAGNAAVQEAFAGKQFMGANYAAVVSPAQFTKSAVQLANTTGVALLHLDKLRTFNPAGWKRRRHHTSIIRASG